jgi:hypothetical protein
VLDLLTNIRSEQTAADDTRAAMLAVLQMILLMRCTPDRLCSALTAKVNGLIVRIIAHPAPSPIAHAAKVVADIANHNFDVVL